MKNMDDISLTLNPFQKFDLENSDYWKDVTFLKHDDNFFAEQIIELSTLFDEAVREGRGRCFVEKYIRNACLMLEKAQERELVRQILIDGLRRLAMSYRFLKRKTRSNLNEPRVSVRHWEVDVQMLKAARDEAAAMEQANIEAQDFDLDRVPEFKKWLADTIQPIISSYIGSAAIKPWAQIRYADAARHAIGWSSMYDRHEFGYFHFDEFCYSMPTIVYLDDVDEECGPFSYVDGSDKLPQNYVLRALHQAVGHHCRINPLKPAERTRIGRLPSALRGGDLVGSFAGPMPFEENNTKLATGDAGLVSLFEGFRLTHAGGHPKTKSRKALFVAYRYPIKRVDDIYGWAGQKYAQHHID